MKEDVHWITREIGIDAGHRVTYHGSKCKNIHGHRYKIQVSCQGPLFKAGEQEGMVLDFSFLKEEMIQVIDAYCDHGTILWVDDPIFRTCVSDDIFERAIEYIRDSGFCLLTEESEIFTKLYVVPFVPTIENLARHWFKRLKPRIAQRSDNQASLIMVKAWETPNCSATYTEG